MKKNFLFAMLAVFLAGFGFGGISLATDYVAKIGEADCTSETPTGCFDTLAAAISDAASGSTITMLSDYEITSAPRINITKKLTLDLNGKTISKSVGGNTEYIFAVNEGAKLTIKDTGENGKIIRTAGVTTIQVLGELDVEGGIIQAGDGCQDFENGCNGSSIAIKVDDNNTPDIYGTLNVNGGTIISDGQAIQAWGIANIAGGTINGQVIAWTYKGDSAGDITIKDEAIINGDVLAVQRYEGTDIPLLQTKVNIQGGTINGSLSAEYRKSGTPYKLITVINDEAPISANDPRPDLKVSGGIFSNDVSDYTTDGKCSIKNDDGKYIVDTCPTASKIFVTSKGTELPIVYDENKAIKLAETQALFNKKPIPSDPQDAAILNAIKTAEELTGTEIVEIEGEDVLFFDVSVAIPSTKQTKAFRGSGSSLFESTSFKVNNPNKDASNITYDLSNAKYPTWVDTSEDILDYNEIKEGSNIIGYTLHTATNYGWFYTPRMYKVTFDTNGGTEEYEAQKVALTEGKATNPGIPTKEGSGFKFWSLSNEENATEYDFSAEVTDDITLYAIYGDDAFTVTWKNGNDIINTGVFASGAMPAYVGDAPSKDADSTCNTYEFKEWTPSVTAVTDEATYTATFTCTSPKSSKSSGGGGGGGSSKVTNTEDTKATTGDTAKVDENNTEENKDENANEEENKGEEKSPMTDAQAVEKFGQEQIDAYKWALENGITTMKTVESARLDQPLTRAELAKMMVVYIQKVLEKDPIVTGDVSYPDVKEELGDLYGYIKLAYQYQIMGINADGTPIEFFNPNGLVTRGEYATVFSRVLFGDKFNKTGEDFYTKHLEALKAAGILTNTIPTIQEMRGWVMLMMYRSSQNSEAIENVANTSETNEEEKADEETATASDETKSEANEEEKAEEATNAEATSGDTAEAPATQESSETTAENTETTAEATTGDVAEAPTAEASTGDTASN